MGDKVTSEEKDKINAAVDALKEALKGTDINEIKAKQEALQKEFYSVSERVYRESAASANSGASPSNDKEDTTAENVYEADYKEVDPDTDDKD